MRYILSAAPLVRWPNACFIDAQLLNLMRARLCETRLLMRLHDSLTLSSLSLLSAPFALNYDLLPRKRSANFHLYYTKVEREKRADEGWLQQNSLSWLHPGLVYIFIIQLLCRLLLLLRTWRRQGIPCIYVRTLAAVRTNFLVRSWFAKPQ